MPDSQERHTMPRPPVWKWEWNITTVISLLLLVVGVIGYFKQQAAFETQVMSLHTQQQLAIDRLADEARNWRANHDQLHRDRLQAVSAESGRTDARLDDMEIEARKLENTIYRLGILEQGAASLTKSLAELTQKTNDIATDVRVIREGVASGSGKPLR